MSFALNMVYEAQRILASKQYLQTYESIRDRLIGQKPSTTTPSIQWASKGKEEDKYLVTTAYVCEPDGCLNENHRINRFGGQESLLRACSDVILEKMVAASKRQERSVELIDLQPWLDVAILLRKILTRRIKI